MYSRTIAAALMSVLLVAATDASSAEFSVGTPARTKTPGSAGFRAFLLLVKVVAGARSDRLHTRLRRHVVQMHFRG